MSRISRWSLSTAAAALLAVLGAAAGAGNVQMARRFGDAATTLSRFQVSVLPVAPAGEGLGLRVDCFNPGPWPVSVLEVQVLAWQEGAYVGAASRDLRGAPLVLAPGTAGSVDLSLPGGVRLEGRDAAGDWRFAVSGRLEVPVLGARTFGRETRYTPEGGA